MTKPQLRSGELEPPHLLAVVLEDTTIKIVYKGCHLQFLFTLFYLDRFRFEILVK